MRRKLLTAAVILAAIPIVVIAAALLYLRFGDLSRHRGTVERLVSDALGRELVIAGDFAPEVGLTTRLVASDVKLANPSWHSEPHMVSVGRLTGEVELLPLLSGRILIHELEVERARVLLESDGAGRATWQFDTTGEPSTEPRPPPEISVGTVELRDVVVVYRDPSFEAPLELSVAGLEATSDDSGVLELQLNGGLNGTVLDLAGRLGPLAGLIAAGAVEHDLTGHLGDGQLMLRGRIQELATLAGADTEIGLEGPDLATVGEPFGLKGLPSDPFRVAATASPATTGTALLADVSLGDMTARIDGTVDSLLASADLDLTVAVSGPDVARIGAITGLEGLPHDPFTVSGRIHWQGFPVAFEGFEARVGDNSLALEGMVGAPPRLLDTDFRVRAAGPNIAALAALAGLEPPAEAFRVDGRLVRVEGGVQLEDIVAEIGRTTLDVHGIVGDPPRFAGTELEFSARGPDLSVYGRLVGIDLPAEPFQVNGRLSPDGDDIALRGVETSVGGNTLQIEGRVAATSGFVGTDLTIRAEGPDLTWLVPITGLSDLPEEPYRVDGGVRVVRDGYQLEGVHAELGHMSGEIDGLIGRAPGLEGTQITVRASGPDLSHLASLVGLENVPKAPFRVGGTVQIVDGGFVLDGVEAALGDLQATVYGHVGAAPDLYGTSLAFQGEGPRLSELQPLVRALALPDAPFAVFGNLLIEPEGYRLDGAVVELAGHRVEAHGLVSVTSGLVGTDLAIALAGPDLGHAGRLVVDTGLTELPELPAEPYTLKGGVNIDEAGYALRTVELTLGTATARLQGKLGRFPGLQGTDLTIDSDGPNASLFTAVTGVTVPVAPFRVRGRVERQESGFRFHGLMIQLGEYHLTANGMLGELPTLIGTDFRVQAKGPSLALIEQLGGPSGFPDQPFELEGHFDGDPRRFKSDRFAVQLGASDVHGSFRLDLGARPNLQATLESSRIDLTRYLTERAERKRAQAEEQEGPPATKPDRVIPDTPLELGLIRSADADIVWTVGELLMPADRFSGVVIDLILEDGRLQLGPIDITGSEGGRLNANLKLEPADGDDYTLRTALTLADGRLDLTQGDDDRTLRPSIDIDLSLAGTGASPHQIAGSSSGNIIVVLGEGQVDNSAIDLVTADILITLLETLNPFAKDQATTTLECAVVVTTFEDGIATLEPMAVQTERMTMLGNGRIDLGTEKLALEWVTKPRKGLGLSASMITNPYIKLGGTLAKPSLEMKPLEAVTTTGIAVATGGLSILGKGLLDRITAERKVCERAIRRAERQAEERAKTASGGP